MAREDEIRILAYRIWEETGCQHGHDCEHWITAEVLWEQNQKKKAASTGNKTQLKPAAKQAKKATTAGKKIR